jgi:membrane protein implicated in regulation of membrane protease activity
LKVATARTLARIDALVWTLIYGGLFAIVIGIAAWRASQATGWSLAVLGVLLVVAGVVLIAVRARLRESPAPGAQSPSDQRRPDA